MKGSSKTLELMPYNLRHATRDRSARQKISAQEVSAQILMKMKKTAEDYLGEPSLTR